MQKSSSLSQKQTDQILKQYICNDKTLEQIMKQKISKNSNLTSTAIIKSLLPRIRFFVFELQKSLAVAKKISQLKIYDHDSETLFLPILMNLNKIIPENARQSFIQLYKNSRLNSIQIIWLTQYNFVYTDQKMQLYNSFIQFCNKQNLFARIRLQQQDPTQGTLPYQSIDKVFPKRDLQLIYKTFKKSNQNVLKTYTNLKKINVNGCQYKNQTQFVYRFDNVLLIGVYEIYKQIYLKGNITEQHWEQFKQYKFYNVNFNQHLNLLFRIAIRKDPNQEQINMIKQIMQRKKFSNYYRQSIANQQQPKKSRTLENSKNQEDVKININPTKRVKLSKNFQS